MTTDEIRVERARVERCFLEWIEAMGLGYWDIRIVYRVEHEDDSTAWTTRMSVAAMWEYQTATVTVYLATTADESDDELHESVAHELCHLIVAELRPPDRDHDPSERQREERVVTQMARALVRTKLRASKPRRGSTKKGNTNG